MENVENNVNKVKQLFWSILIWNMLFLAYSAVFPGYGTAYAKSLVPVQRLSGTDRYETAAAISKEGWAASEWVVLAGAEGDDKFADAIAGSTLSYTLNTPVLLTSADEINECTQDEITRLKAKKAVILGGHGVISDKAVNQLKGMGLSVERLWGTDRYETAVRVGEKVREYKAFSRVFLTTGEKFQYAMMIAPFASKNGIPILFSEKDSLNSGLKDALVKWEVSEVDIIGNADAVSKAVEDSLKSMGISVKRVSGANMADINISIIYKYKMDESLLAAAREDVFADGLAGAAFAALKNMHMVLCGRDSVEPIAAAYLNDSGIEYSYIFGGPGGVSDYIIPLIRKGTTNSPVFGNTPENMSRGGLTAESSGWIYYQHPIKEGRLYKKSIDGTEETEVCKDKPMNINILGDWIYYTNITDGFKIYKIKSDGICRTRLNDDESLNMVLADNWIYYINKSDKGHIYKIAADGTLKARLNQSSSLCLNAEGDWIYYINADDSWSIHRLKWDNPSETQKLKDIYASSMHMEEGYIYFSNLKDGRVPYRINTDGTELTKLSGSNADDVHAVEDFIYNKDSLYKEYVDILGKTSPYEEPGIIDSEKIEWVKFSKTKPAAGIPVKDAFKRDGRKIAFLTFDDGPSSKVTPAILDILKDRGISATFFVVGKMASRNSGMIKRIYSEGHSIANHSYSHEYEYIYNSVENFTGEIKRWEKVMKGILGDAFESRVFRFPGGRPYNNQGLYKAALSELGYEAINWNGLTGDGLGQNIPVKKLIQEFKNTYNNADHIVILMHDMNSKETTVEALPEIIEFLKSQGYEFEKLI